MNLRSKLVSIVGAGLIVLSSVTGVAAQASNSANVNVTIQGPQGGLSIVDVQQVNQSQTVNVDFNKGANVTGSVTLTLEDARFSRVGWSLNVSASDFQGSQAQNTLPVAVMAVNQVAVSKVHGDEAPQASPQNFVFTKEGAKIVSAPAGTGSGRYTVVIGTRIVVPANTTADTYTSTITFALSAAP